MPGLEVTSANKLEQGTEVRKTAVFTVAHLFNDSYPNLFPILLPELMPILNFSTAQAGLVSVVSSLTTQLLQPLMGLWADRAGGRAFVVGGLIIGSVMVSLGFAWAPSYSLLLLALLIGGLGNAAFHPHAAALVSNIAGKRKGLGMSFFMVGGQLGRAVASLMAGAAFAFGGRHAVMLVALPGLIMAVVMAQIMSPPPPPKPRSEAILTPDFLQGLRQSGGLMAVVALRSMATLSILTLVPILWKTWGYHVAETAGLVTIFFITGSIGNITGGGLSDKLGPKPVMFFSVVLSFVGLLLFINSSNSLLAYTLFAVLGFTLYASTSVTMVFSHALFPQNKGMASGIVLGFGNTLGSLGVAAIGFIADRYTPVTGLTLVSMALLLAIPFILVLKAPKEAS